MLELDFPGNSEYEKRENKGMEDFIEKALREATLRSIHILLNAEGQARVKDLEVDSMVGKIYLMTAEIFKRDDKEAIEVQESAPYSIIDGVITIAEHLLEDFAGDFDPTPEAVEIFETLRSNEGLGKFPADEAMIHMLKWIDNELLKADMPTVDDPVELRLTYIGERVFKMWKEGQDE